VGELEIVEEKQDPTYVPSDADIENYAVNWLFMDPVADKSLFWIAKEGLTAPMPAHWSAVTENDGTTSYYNMTSYAVSDRHPNDQIYYDKFQDEKAKWDKIEAKAE